MSDPETVPQKVEERPREPMRRRGFLRRRSRKFRRIEGPSWVGGVCAGMAYSLGMPTWLVRLIWIAAGAHFHYVWLAYFVLWFVVPLSLKTPPDYTERTGDTGVY